MQREGYPAITSPGSHSHYLKQRNVWKLMRRNPVSINALTGSFLIPLAHLAMQSQLHPIHHAVLSQGAAYKMQTIHADRHMSQIRFQGTWLQILA